jgi:muramidase (phage lysozyme)
MYKKLVFLSISLGLTILLFNLPLRSLVRRSLQPISYKTRIYKTQPLVMTGGDPYVRALMRTITASEANVEKPYNVIYGGEYISDLSEHPKKCITIVVGPNTDNCTTAAGRYQFIHTTWEEKAKAYHPNMSRFLFWDSYSFEPQYQDAVVYSWLKDSQAWGSDIPQLLHDGKIEEVLRLLSTTWTSLGYGIETNSMSKYLPKIYENSLKEELKGSEYTLNSKN